MSFIKIKKKIKKFNKNLITVGDKSLSIRWALLASQSLYKSRSYNLLISEDVINTLSCLKKLGVKIKLTKKFCEIYGVGLNGFKYKKKLSLNAGNSGTLGRLIMGLLVHSKNNVELKGTTAEVEKIMGTMPRQISEIKIKILFNKNFDKITKRKLESAALTCPVSNSLNKNLEESIKFIYP